MRIVDYSGTKSNALAREQAAMHRRRLDECERIGREFWERVSARPPASERD